MLQNKDKRTNNLITKKWQTAFVHHEKVYNLQMKTSTETFYRPQFGFFGKQKIIIGKHYFSALSQKALT